MLYAGLDLSRKKVDVHVLDEAGKTVAVTAVAPEGWALQDLVRRFAGTGEEVTAVIESMNGAHFVHDTLELAGWDVLIADAARARALAPLAAKTDRIDAWVLAELGRRDLVPAIRAARHRDPERQGGLSLPPAPGRPPDRPSRTGSTPP